MAQPSTSAIDQALAVLDTYNRQADAVSRQLNFLQAVLNETVQARESLAGLGKEESKELLVPVGANTFLYAQATRKDRVLSGIGGGLSVEKSWQEAAKGLGHREEEVRAEMQRLSEIVVRLQQEAATLQERIETDLEAAGRAVRAN